MTILERGDFIQPLPDDQTEPRPGNKGVPPANFQMQLENDPAIVADLIKNSQASIETLKHDIQTKSGVELFDFILEDTRVKAACRALGVPRSTHYRSRRPPAPPRIRPPHRPHPRALSSDEQAAVRAQLHSDRFVDRAPRAISATLLDEGTRLCHWSTMYRLLRADAASSERRAIRRHVVYARPELLATAPRQVWSWDITKLRGPQPGSWYNVYIVLDIFSRMIVGWLVAEREDASLAEILIADACTQRGLGHSS